MQDKDMVTNMTVAVNKARRLLIEWEYTGDAQSISDGEALAVALVIADRQMARYKEGLEYRPPCQ